MRIGLQPLHATWHSRFACIATFISALLCNSLAAADQFNVLDAYTRYADSKAVNLPKDYIAWLKSQPQFQNGQLDNLPKQAIILHNVKVREFLNGLGYQDAEIEELTTGHADPNVMFVVRPKTGPGFIVNRGMPGAGGISTQISELAALGVERAIHIGICGLLGEQIPYGSLIISNGSYKDGAAFLLASTRMEAAEQIAFSDRTLSDQIEQQLKQTNIKYIRATGFTSPIYYFQKSGLIKTLLAFRPSQGTVPAYVEMEQATFFVVARINKVAAASIVVGSDRAVLIGKDIKQQFYDGSTDPLLSLAVRHAVAVLSAAR